MDVVRIDTLWLGEFTNVLFILVHTDEGLVELGETYFGAQATEAYIHETAAPYLLGKDPLRIDRHARGYTAPELGPCGRIRANPKARGIRSGDTRCISRRAYRSDGGVQ